MIELGKPAHDKSFLRVCAENAELKKKLEKAIKALELIVNYEYGPNDYDDEIIANTDKIARECLKEIS